MRSARFPPPSSPPAPHFRKKSQISHNFPLTPNRSGASSRRRKTRRPDCRSLWVFGFFPGIFDRAASFLGTAGFSRHLPKGSKTERGLQSAPPMPVRQKWTADFPGHRSLGKVGIRHRLRTAPSLPMASASLHPGCEPPNHHRVLPPSTFKVRRSAFKVQNPPFSMIATQPKPPLQ